MHALRTAWVNFEAQRLDQARSICAQILISNPTQADAEYLLGLTYLKDGDMASAIQLLERLIKRSPAKPAFLASLAFAYHEQGNIDKAIALYQQAIHLDPRYVDAYYNLHAAEIKAQDLSLSIACLEKLLDITPHDFDAIFMLGLLLDYQGDTQKANKMTELIPSSNPLLQSRIDAWNYLKNDFPAKYAPITGSIYQTFSIAFEAAKVDGLVLEFGVRHGNSIRQLAELAQQQVHGFDSFEGLPEAWHTEDKGSYSTKGVIPKVPANVSLYQGWFDKTLPDFLAQHPESARLINIDCDIYSSTKTVLDLLAPRIKTGTVIIFDEYIGNQYWREDEFKAFQEAIKSYGWKYEYLSFSFFTKQVAFRII